MKCYGRQGRKMKCVIYIPNTSRHVMGVNVEAWDVTCFINTDNMCKGMVSRQEHGL